MEAGHKVAGSTAGGVAGSPPPGDQRLEVTLDL